MTIQHGRPPTVWHHFRQIIGRAFRETGQCVHRLAVKGEALAVTPNDYYDDPVIYEDHLSRHRRLFPLLLSGRPVLHKHISYVAPCATLVGSVYVDRNASIWYGAVLRGDTCLNTASLLTNYKIEAGIDDDDDGVTDSNNLLLDSQNGEASSTVPKATSIMIGDEKIDVDQLQKIPKPWELSATRYRDRKNNHGGMIYIGKNTNVQDGAIITAHKNHCTIGNNVTIGHSAQLHSCTIHDNVLIGMGSYIGSNSVIESNAFIAAGTIIPENTTIPSGTLVMGNPGRVVKQLSPERIEKIQYQSDEYVNVALTHQHIMELGGNIDTETGVSVYITSDATDSDDAFTDEQQQAQLESNAPLTIDTLSSGTGSSDDNKPTTQQNHISVA